jgi:hypothetical protein
LAYNYTGSIYKPKVQGSLSDRLATYASDKDALNDELARSSQVYNVKKALGDMQGANAAHEWANKLRQVGGIANQYTSTGAPIGNPYDQQVNTLQQTLQNRINNPEPVNVYNTDAWKAAMAESQRQAGLATRATQESLGNSGFARSTALTDRVQRIQNDANNYLQTQVAPTIANQEYAKQQQQVQNLQAMLSELRNSQGLYDTRQQNQFSNQLATNADKRASSESAMGLRTAMGSLTGIDPRTGQATYQAQQDSLQNRLAQTAADRSYGLSLDDNARGWANFGLDQQKYASQNAGLEDLQKAQQSAYKYIDSIKYNTPYKGNDPKKIGTMEQIGISPQLRSQVTAGYNTELQNYLSGVEDINSPRSKQYLIDRYGQFSGTHIYNALLNTMGSISNPK